MQVADVVEFICRLEGIFKEQHKAALANAATMIET